jgi:hypothetical protein
MDAAGFLSPNFKHPFEGFSVYETKGKITKFKPVLWADPAISDTLPACTMISRMKRVRKPLKKAFGLELEDFEEEEEEEEDGEE